MYIFLMQLHEESKEKIPYYEKLRNAVRNALPSTISIPMHVYMHMCLHCLLVCCVYTCISMSMPILLQRMDDAKASEMAILNKSLYEKPEKKRKNIQVQYNYLK